MPDPLGRAVRVRRTGRRLRLAPALTELAADCVLGVGMLWLLISPIAFFVLAGAVFASEGAEFLAIAAVVEIVHVLGALVIGAPVALALNVSESVRWLELRPVDRPTHIVLRLCWRQWVVPVADLTEVVVREHRRYGKPPRVEVDLVTAGQTYRCPRGKLGPLRRVDSQALAGWLSEVLVNVPVRHEFVVVEQPIARQWWPAKRVAAAWQVPVEQVPDLARQWEIRTTDRDGTPMYRALEVEERTVLVRGG